ncbi:MAG TPA: aspartate 1-decarboxylase [Aggregatilineaceae bacterium]|jgi:aspartate 1-decarboxylase|nr:aspartate 1-decarboxylase [Aggregatilineaceae bacterium]
MQVSMLRAKLHQARVTHADPDYVGSITIDPDILEQVGMLPYEKVLIADIESGERFETYIIAGTAGSRVIQLNGAAAHLVTVGDRLIIMAFSLVDFPPPKNWSPQVVVLDEANNVKSIARRGQYR